MVIGLVEELQNLQKQTDFVKLDNFRLESELVHVCHNGKAFEGEFYARQCQMLCEGPYFIVIKL